MKELARKTPETQDPHAIRKGMGSLKDDFRKSSRKKKIRAIPGGFSLSLPYGREYIKSKVALEP